MAVEQHTRNLNGVRAQRVDAAIALAREQRPKWRWQLDYSGGVTNPEWCFVACSRSTFCDI